MNKEFEVSIGTTKIAPGWTVDIEPVKPFQVRPGYTSRHEGIHTVTAIITGTHVIEASRNPGPGYRGRTILAEKNAIAGIAAHAMGCGGTAYDVMIVRLQGHDPNSLASVARSILSGHEDEIYDVASAIEAKGAISGDEAEQIIYKARNPEAKVEITDPLGQKWNFVIKTKEVDGYFIPIEIPAPPENTETSDNNQKEKDKLSDIFVNARPFTDKLGLKVRINHRN